MNQKEVKLVLFDMDGTLLNSKKELPKEFNDIAKKMINQGIKIAIASGRQYQTLIEQFSEFKDDFIFISDNGTICYYHDQCILSDQLTKEEVLHSRQKLSDSKASMIYCGIKSAYTENSNQEFINIANIYYKNFQVVKSINNIDDKICKLAIYHEENASKLLDLYKGFSNTLTPVHSAKNWLDISHSNISKGSALIEIQKMFNISYYQTMAFGDYLNDLEMLKNSYYSFAMENAVDEIKRVSNFNTLSNDENGVIYALKNHFDFLNK